MLLSWIAILMKKSYLKKVSFPLVTVKTDMNFHFNCHIIVFMIDEVHFTNTCNTLLGTVQSKSSFKYYEISKLFFFFSFHISIIIKGSRQFGYTPYLVMRPQLSWWKIYAIHCTVAQEILFDLEVLPPILHRRLPT